MDDLIKRQDAITAYCEHECGIKGMTRENCGATECGTIFDDIPSAQSEIIMCKDCIWFDRYTDGIEKYQWDGFCAEWARNTYENWYCSRGEGKNEK